MPFTTVAQALAKALETYTRLVFGSPTPANLELFDALSETKDVHAAPLTDPRWAPMMACGVAKVKPGRVASLNLVEGPDLLHSLPGLVEARRAQLPMVALITCGPENGPSWAGGIQLLKGIVKERIDIHTPEEVAEKVRRAFYATSRHPRGPVALTIPSALLPITFEQSPPTTAPLIEHLAPDLEQVQQAARLLNQTQRPLIIANAPRLGSWLRPLAERLEATVVTLPLCKGDFPENHPLWLWNDIGKEAPEFTEKLLAQSDCVLTLGVPPRFSTKTQPKTWIAWSTDQNPGPAATIQLIGPPAATFEALLEQLQPRSPSPSLQRQIKRARDRALKIHRKKRAPNEAYITPNDFFSALEGARWSDAIFCVEGGRPLQLAREHLRLKHPNRFLCPNGPAHPGFAIPAAIGASLARLDLEVLALIDEEALLRSGVELLTAKELGLGMLICVLREGERGQVAQAQRLLYQRESCASLPDFDLQHLARLAGARWIEVDNPESLEEALAQSMDLARGTQPAIIEVWLDRYSTTLTTQAQLHAQLRTLPRFDRLRALNRLVARRFRNRMQKRR